MADRLRSAGFGRCLLIAAVLLPAAAHANPSFILRMATIAPDGTSWARSLRQLSREVFDATDGSVQVKWLFGGIAGDELSVLDRIKRGEIDGIAAAMTCNRLAPTLRSTLLIGLMESPEEANYVLEQLSDQIDSEFRHSGFVPLAYSTFGTFVMFARRPIRSLAELRDQHLWINELDEPLRLTLGVAGAGTVPLSISEAGAAYENGRVGGFITTPVVALAFQWSAHLRYVINVPLAFLSGCVVVSRSAFARLPPDYGKILRERGASVIVRFTDDARRQEDELLGGLFEHQGIHTVPVNEAFRHALFNRASAAVDELGERVLSREMRERIRSLVAGYRAEHKR